MVAVGLGWVNFYPELWVNYIPAMTGMNSSFNAMSILAKNIHISLLLNSFNLSILFAQPYLISDLFLPQKTSSICFHVLISRVQLSRQIYLQFIKLSILKAFRDLFFRHHYYAFHMER